MKKKHKKSIRSNMVHPNAVRNRVLLRSIAKANLTTKEMRKKGYTKLFRIRQNKKSLFSHIWRDYAVDMTKPNKQWKKWESGKKSKMATA